MNELTRRIDGLNQRIAQLGNERASARGQRRAQLQQEIRSREQARDTLEAERAELGREAADIRDAANHIRSRTLQPLPCFSANTLVWTIEGVKPIHAICVGDQVCTFDFENNRLTLTTVAQVLWNKTHLFYEIQAGDKLVQTTRFHRFWVENKQDWIAAQDLQLGWKLRLITGEMLKINAITPRAVPESDTFNLSLNQHFNYFVEQGILVHNNGSGVATYSYGSYVVYEGTNPAFPNDIYIGHSIDADIREGGHQREAIEALQNSSLTAEQRRFFEFKRGMRLRVRVQGLDLNQARYLEQRNIELERAARGAEHVMNRINAVAPEQMPELRRQIASDPRVRARGDC